MLFFLFVFVYFFYFFFFVLVVFCCCCCCFIFFVLLFLVIQFVCFILFYYFTLSYFTFGLFVSWFPYMSLMSFLVSLVVWLFFQIAVSGREGFSTQFLLSFFFLLFFSRRNGYFNSLVGWVKDSSSAGQSMTYVSVLGAYSSFVGFGWIKNYLLLYLSRMYFFTNYLQFLHVLYVCTCICLCLCVFVCAPMRGCTVICQLC